MFPVGKNWRKRLSGWLFDRDNAIGGHIPQFLNYTRGPADFDKVRRGVGPEAEMNRTGAGGSITGAGGHVVILGAGLGDNLYSGSYAVAIAFGSLEF